MWATVEHTCYMSIIELEVLEFKDSLGYKTRSFKSLPHIFTYHQKLGENTYKTHS